MNSYCLSLAVGLAAMALWSCATPHGDQPSQVDPAHTESYIPRTRVPTKQSPEAVIRIAVAFAKVRKIDLSGFEAPVTRDPIVLLGHITWSVHFSGKGVLLADGTRIYPIGDFFDVLVDDETGHADLMGGL
jgi:hypothetical protein